MKKEQLEFQELGEPERKILLSALDIGINNLKCRYCKEKISYKDCSIMPSVKGDKNATITCSSPLCISEYLGDSEEETSEECCQKTAKEIFNGIENELFLDYNNLQIFQKLKSKFIKEK